MGLFEVMLVVHILTAALWIGGGVLALLIGAQLRKHDPNSFGSFVSALAKLGGPFFGGSGGLVGLTGIVMIMQEGGAEFSDLWVSIGFAGWLVSLILGGAVVGRAWAKVGELAAAGSATPDEISAKTDFAVMTSWLDLALRAAIVVVMVWRPT